ncbi:MAG: hypothetical protein V1859_01195 [archaeon]
MPAKFNNVELTGTPGSDKTGILKATLETMAYYLGVIPLSISLGDLVRQISSQTLGTIPERIPDLPASVQ